MYSHHGRLELRRPGREEQKKLDTIVKAGFHSRSSIKSSARLERGKTAANIRGEFVWWAL